MGNRQLIDILQLVAKAYAARYGRDLHVGEGLEAAEQVEERGLALDRGRNGDDHLLDLARQGENYGK